MEDLIEAPQIRGIEQSHVNKWVAVTKKNGELLTVADSLAEVLSKSRSMKDTIVFKVLPQIFVGG